MEEDAAEDDLWELPPLTQFDAQIKIPGRFEMVDDCERTNSQKECVL